MRSVINVKDFFVGDHQSFAKEGRASKRSSELRLQGLISAQQDACVRRLITLVGKPPIRLKL